MNVCILNSTTKVVENIIVLTQDEMDNFVPYKGGIELAPQHDGQIGWTWNGSGWDVPPEPTISDDELIVQMREVRNKWLRRNIDSINPVRWETFTDQKKQEWRDYRQLLLNVPQQEGFPHNVIWPTKPE
jgi:hypothetical protein